MKNTTAIAGATGETWYIGVLEIAAILGVSENTARAFVQEQNLAWRKIGRLKKYFLPEVLDAMEKQRWKH
jgi:hypothetical protein